MSECRWCGTPLSSRRVFCDNVCQGMRRSEDVVDAWLAGDDPGWTGVSVQLKVAVRDHVLMLAGYACSICGWDKRHYADGRSLVQVDHIDGNAMNCHISNLRALCPNCHAATATYGARNRGNGTRYRNYTGPLSSVD